MDNVEQVGTQVRLPFSRAFQIAVKGIRIRLGRSMVTLSGVVLGIAFLMSNLTGQLIKRAVSEEQARRQKVNLMLTIVRSEIGDVQGKALAIAGFGTLSDAERLLVTKLVEQKPAQLRGFGISAAGVAPAEVKGLGEGTSLLLVLGDAGDAPVSLSELGTGMRQKVVLDSVANRRFTAGDAAAIRRVPFFGQELEQNRATLEKEAAAATVRNIWIVVISLLVTVIGISNALLMSVTERFREIGTMKCLGALSSFIRMLFLIESSLIGFAGSLIGALVGAFLPLVAYGFTYGFAAVFGSVSYAGLGLAGLESIVAGTILAVVAAIYPASFASRMVPASALRSTV